MSRLTDLKVMAYDTLAQLDNLRARLQEINNEINKEAQLQQQAIQQTDTNSDTTLPTMDQQEVPQPDGTNS